MAKKRTLHQSGGRRVARDATTTTRTSKANPAQSDEASGLRVMKRVFGRVALAAMLGAPMLVGQLAAQQPAAVAGSGTETIELDAGAQGRAFPHYWERMFGSGRAILTLRESYRRDLREVKDATDFEFVRFHDILDDDVGVYDEDAGGRPVYNFSYVDQIYDGLLENGVRPFVELSFTPRKLAAQPLLHAFWYKPIVAPPKDWGRWSDLVGAFATHLVERYGIDEVSKWYFEVWNEPNIDFWAGEPKQSTYYQLYDGAARALKQVSVTLRVGGPASAQAAWVDSFIHHAVDAKVPLDFVSTHVYGNDSAKDVFGTSESIPRTEMVGRAARKVYDEVKASPRPDLPIFWSEFNASYKNEPDVTDAPYMGPWLANTIRQCDGLTAMLSYWTLSDVFDEQGVVKQPFYGGYGLIAEGGLPKPAFNAFTLLHRLGSRRIATPSSSALITRRDDGSWALALWNLEQGDRQGASKEIAITIKGWPHGSQPRAVISRLDSTHGSVMPAYEAMGRPVSPTREQLRVLRVAAGLAPEQTQGFQAGRLVISVPPAGLVLLEVR
jgi:xylan 1,4-beta-xylosidase